MKKSSIYMLAALCCFGGKLFAQSASHSTQAITKDLNYFTDWTASELAKSVKPKHIKEFHSPVMKELAEKLSAGSYQSQYLLHAYKPVASDKELKKALKLSDGYSRYENMTGVFLEKGENVVLVGDMHGRNVKLLIPEWMRQPTPEYKPTEDPEGWDLKCQKITLREGVNVINVEKAGNVYIDYFADDVETAPEITVHFVTGKVNGYFDAKNMTNEDWKRLLDNAVSPVLDVKTKYMQLAYPVEFLKKFAYNEGKELTGYYDKVMEAQYEFCGALKYNRVPDKRILARVNYNYFMFRDGDGVAFEGVEPTMKSVIGKDIVTNWGIHHEIGHVMQMTPQLTWSGMTEVSNNLFSIYATMRLGAPNRLSQDKMYEAGFKNVLDASEKKFIMNVGDPFHKLIPFWQIQIYAKQKGYHDFYADLMEHMRNTPDKGTGNDSFKNMYEYVKLCCDLLKTDLTDFFDTWGFFVTGKVEGDDYGKYEFEVTPKMVEEVKSYIASKHYPKPEKDITRLTD